MKGSWLLGTMMVATTAQAGVDSLQWLSGSWCGTHNGIYSEEIWTMPKAQSLIGMHRDSKGGKLVSFEFFRIVEDGTDLVYWTQPGGRPAIAFRAKVAGQDSVSFVNAQHDFPKRITYRRLDATTLLARVDDGTDGGQSMEWRWQECEKK